MNSEDLETLSRVLDNTKTFNEAKRFAIVKMLREYHYDELKKEPEKYFACFREKDNICKYIVKRTGQRWKYFMVTVNFMKDVDFKLAFKKLEKCLKKIWIKDYIYCWEWRGEDKGMHIHMRIEPKDGKKIYDCKREVYNTFKHLVGNKMHINMRYSNREDCFKDYIKGFKDGKRKNCWEVSQIMRNKHNLSDYYVKARPPRTPESTKPSVCQSGV